MGLFHRRATTGQEPPETVDLRDALAVAHLHFEKAPTLPVPVQRDLVSESLGRLADSARRAAAVGHAERALHIVDSHPEPSTRAVAGIPWRDVVDAARAELTA